jgi:hypothetical protein
MDFVLLDEATFKDVLQASNFYCFHLIGRLQLD